jgi:hypothetical protein
MKRAMAQATQCVHCLQPVKKGWGQLNHKKICMGAPATYKVSQTKTANQVDTEVDDNHNIHEMEGEGQDEAHEMEGEGQDEMEGEGQDEAVLNDVMAEPIRKARLGPKTLEILTFLDTAEKGEGCSREKAQSWLDYHHMKGGPNSRLLPKDIRTLWKHVTKVWYILRGHLSSCNYVCPCCA